ncbi:MAG: UDP-N-acetylmuramate dehydrogenase [Chlorobia bacterium]|nr:UDP-N-acetylmuramate dehydrogenase [Fimbriimonadaceae bacterium]
MRLLTTLKAGGKAERFCRVSTSSQLAGAAQKTHANDWPTTILGWGSNMLPSDYGVPGLVIWNQSKRIAVARSGEVLADTGCAFQELFLKTAQAGLRGLEFAVGIPGSLGGALVSNAGAYRSNVSEFITRLEVVSDGERKWVSPDELEFSYRDSILRRSDPPKLVVLKVEMKLPQGDPKTNYDEAREYQRQRISKQPPPASAGSFFKNVLNAELAQTLPGLTDGMRKAGVVPAGFLIEAAGLKGFRMGGAMQGARHANFILNVGNATAFEIRRLATHTKRVVMDKFQVELDEEVLYLGDWSRFVEG